MHYPIFDPGPMGPSTLIAVMAIVHILIAHFAVGAGIATPWLEARAMRNGDTLLAGFLRRYARFLILLSFVGGAVTGVGIWFVVGLISPETISLLIRQFVWGWATEWVFFIVEITSGYVYYFYWDQMKPKTHLAVGIVYAISAWMSLFIINGILTFMLTPGDWLVTRSFWDGWINPTFWPSLVLRTISALAIAGIFVAVVANLDKSLDREKRRHIIGEGSVFLVPLAIMIPASAWFFAVSPAHASDLALGGAVAMTMFFGFGILASTLVGLYAYFGLIKNKRLINIIQNFVKQTKRYRIDILKSPERLRRSVEAHEKIIQSFESRDAEKAEKLRKESILGNIKIFTKKFKERSEERRVGKECRSRWSPYH